MKTQKEVRANFWESHPQFKSEYKKSYRQNQYRADIRMAFVDYVDHLAKDGIITNKLAYKVTL